jgi:hypothetical protein
MSRGDLSKAKIHVLVFTLLCALARVAQTTEFVWLCSTRVPARQPYDWRLLDFRVTAGTTWGTSRWIRKL